jgi:molybdopterin converting factor subunit 1
MHILFFAQLKDATNCDAIELFLPAPLNAEQLWKILLEKFPALALQKKGVRLAKNSEYSYKQTIFFDADEVALIPPVSGG